jgi:hypothetical protein
VSSDNSSKSDQMNGLSALEAENATLRQLAAELAASVRALEARFGSKSSRGHRRKARRALAAPAVVSPYPQGHRLPPV